jgi:hypothetical protein
MHHHVHIFELSSSNSSYFCKFYNKIKNTFFRMFILSVFPLFFLDLAEKNAKSTMKYGPIIFVGPYLKINHLKRHHIRCLMSELPRCPAVRAGPILREVLSSRRRQILIFQKKEFSPPPGAPVPSLASPAAPPWPLLLPLPGPLLLPLLPLLSLLLPTYIFVFYVHIHLCVLCTHSFTVFIEFSVKNLWIFNICEIYIFQ